MFVIGCSVFVIGCLVFCIGCPVYIIGCPVFCIGCPVFIIGCPVFVIGCPVFGIGCPVFESKIHPPLHAKVNVNTLQGWHYHDLQRPSLQIGLSYLKYSIFKFFDFSIF